MVFILFIGFFGGVDIFVVRALWKKICEIFYLVDFFRLEALQSAVRLLGERGSSIGVLTLEADKSRHRMLSLSKSCEKTTGEFVCVGDFILGYVFFIQTQSPLVVKIKNGIVSFSRPSPR